jgi:predicted alpha/beta superfamily hydrolase
MLSTAIALIALGSPAQQRTTSLTGNIKHHNGFESKILGNKRNLIVYLPPAYEQNANRRYPVLYMHDGQNIFDDATSFAGEWRADETAKRLIDEGKIVPIIIVAIENAGAARINEYTNTTEPVYVADKKAIDEGKKKKEDVETEGGKGEQYAQFLITEVKPFIDQTYRTKADRANTAVAGSSLGGLMSLYLAWKHKDVFSKFGVISPSLWWDNAIPLKLVKVKGAPLCWDLDGGKAVIDPNVRGYQNHGIKGGTVGFSDGHVDFLAPTPLAQRNLANLTTINWIDDNWPAAAQRVLQRGIP